MKTLQQVHDYVIETNTAALLAQVTQTTTTQATTQDKPVSIYFLMNFTINPIAPILQLYLQESQLRPELLFGQYDNVMQEVLDDFSLLYSKKIDIIVCALWQDPSDEAFLNKLNDIESFINELKTLFDLLQEKSSSLILINTFLLPFWSETGITSGGDTAAAIRQVNQFLRNYIEQHASRCFLMDWERYAQILGEANSMDYRYWYLYKSPFKKAFLSYYASDITRVARALNGYAKKCLILDCDNTLWGGIIGEDGISGIKLDNYDYPGKVFTDFQKSVLKLHKRGVILALCSKNNEDDVWAVFDTHPASLLRREHFAIAKINWADKADNILDLVKALNIGLDSCVFVDDSPTECERVKSALPQVTVLSVPNPIYTYPSLLLREGLFDTLKVSEEDAGRNIQYQQEAKRQEFFKQSQNIDEYLSSLGLIATICRLQENDIARVTQLTQKTNQFNLSTKRYNQQQIENFSTDKDKAVFSLKVKDKFGDYGLTGVLIAKREADKGVIDSFLLSCRILSRRLEYAFLEYGLKYLSQIWQVKHWEAPYCASEKNSQIPDFLQRAGFQMKDNNIYQLHTEAWSHYPINHISVITEGFEYA